MDRASPAESGRPARHRFPSRSRAGTGRLPRPEHLDDTVQIAAVDGDRSAEGRKTIDKTEPQPEETGIDSPRAEQRVGRDRSMRRLGTNRPIGTPTGSHSRAWQRPAPRCAGTYGQISREPIALTQDSAEVDFTEPPQFVDVAPPFRPDSAQIFVQFSKDDHHGLVTHHGDTGRRRIRMAKTPTS